MSYLDEPDNDDLDMDSGVDVGIAPEDDDELLTHWVAIAAQYEAEVHRLKALLVRQAAPPTGKKETPDFLLITPDNTPLQVIAELKRMFSVTWWAGFVGALLDRKQP